MVAGADDTGKKGPDQTKPGKNGKDSQLILEEKKIDTVIIRGTGKLIYDKLDLKISWHCLF
jgi:hypothetical protein